MKFADFVKVEAITARLKAVDKEGVVKELVENLVKAGEINGMQLLTLHNIAFMNRLMAAVREAIRGDRYAEATADWLAPA